MSKQILPPNDPNRPEWSILSRLTRREQLYSPGMSPARASAVMKNALEEAWLARPREVIAACDERRMKGLSRDYVERPAEFNEVMGFLEQRLWLNTRDGTVPTPKSIERGSSGFGIRYWEPANGGLVSYIRARIGWVLTDYATMKVEEGKHTSLERLASSGVDLTTDSTFIRQQKLNSDDLDDPEVASAAAAQGGTRLGKSAVLAGESAGDGPGDGADGEITEDIADEVGERAEGEVPVSANDHRRNLLESFVRQSYPDFLASPNRGEFGFFSNVLGHAIDPASAPEDRCDQLKALADEVFESHCKDLPERDAVAEDLRSWNPATNSFFKQFPDVTEFVVDTLARPDLRPGTDHVNRDAADVARFLGLTAPENQSPGQLDLLPNAIQSTAEAHRVLRVSDMWNRRATPEMLDSPERPDYEFLCDVTKTDFDESLSPEELHAAVKSLSMQWLRLAIPDSNDPKIGWRHLVERALDKWEPNESLFGEVVYDTLSELVQERALEGEISEDLENLDGLRAHPGKTPAEITAIQAAKVKPLEMQPDLFGGPTQ